MVVPMSGGFQEMVREREEAKEEFSLSSFASFADASTEHGGIHGAGLLSVRDSSPWLPFSCRLLFLPGVAARG